MVMLKHDETRAPLVGGWLGTRSPAVVDACREAGLEFVVLDTQHSALTLGDCAELLAGVEADDFKTFLQQQRHHHRADITVMSSHQ